LQPAADTQTTPGNERRSGRRVATNYPGVYYRDRDKGRVYEIAYTDSYGKRRFQTVAGGLKDAQRVRAQVLEKMHRGERVAPSKVTVRELAEEWLKTQEARVRLWESGNATDRRPLRRSTLETYEYSLDHWALPRLGHLRVSSVTPNDIADFVAEMAKTKKAWTIRGCLTPLSMMFEYARRRKGLAAINPVRDLAHDERPRGGARQMRILSPEEIGALFRASTDTYSHLWLVLVLCGLRISEALALRWEDVDFVDQLLHVRQSKTAAGVRSVAMPQVVARELARRSLAGGTFVFQTKEGQPMKRRRVTRALEETLRRAGVPHCRLHDLRHTFASVLIGQGEDVTYVAHQMGHASPQVTLGIYAKLYNPRERQATAMKRMDQSFAGMVG